MHQVVFDISFNVPTMQPVPRLNMAYPRVIQHPRLAPPENGARPLVTEAWSGGRILDGVHFVKHSFS